MSDPTEKFRAILRDAIQADGALRTPNAYQYMRFEPGDKDIKLDGNFEPDELEALVWWIRNHQEINK